MSEHRPRWAPGLIWWLWTAFDPVEVQVFDVGAAWEDYEPYPDVYWLGECAWTARLDNMALGLR